MKKRFHFYFFNWDIMTSVMYLTVLFLGFVGGIIWCAIVKPYDENRKIIYVKLSNRKPYNKNLIYWRLGELAKLTDTLTEFKFEKYFKEYDMFGFINGGPELILKGHELDNWTNNPRNIKSVDLIDSLYFAFDSCITDTPFWEYIIINKQYRERLLYCRNHDEFTYYILRGDKVVMLKQISLDIKIDTLIYNGNKLRQFPCSDGAVPQSKLSQ